MKVKMAVCGKHADLVDCRADNTAYFNSLFILSPSSVSSLSAVRQLDDDIEPDRNAANHKEFVKFRIQFNQQELI